MIETASDLAVSLCYCRHKAEHLGTSCGAPLEVCLSLNGGQIADNVRDRPSYLCNCCGVCADACNRDATRMERRERQPFVPRNAVDRALRIALERGKLADLLFDEDPGA